MAVITLEDVTKTYNDGALVAVDGISVSIEDGEFFVLLGPSGCGKSTTLRMIAGLETITGGEIRIGDRAVNGLEPRERNVAMVFQNYALYPHMNVRENLGFGLRLSTELSDADIERKVEEVAELMDIAELLDDVPKELSGGQQQRVALGRAIVREPDVFLFDEPLSNLDAKLRAHMRTELARLQGDLGVTSLYVTHDQTEAMTMGDRIAVMNDGVLQQVGTTNEVYDHPANRFVAEFIGSPSMNFLSVELVEREEGYALVGRDGDGFAYPLERGLVHRLDAAPGSALALGVRPEDIALHATTDGRSDRVQTADIDVVEEMGSDDFVYLHVADVTWTAREEDRIDVADGTVAYGFDPHDLYLFGPDGRTIKSKGLDGDAADQSSETTTVGQSVS
jgi:multiple sugar transport system ATP-binding protein